MSGGKAMLRSISRRKAAATDRIQDGFYHYTKFTYRHSYAMLLFPLLIAGGLGYFLLHRDSIQLAEQLYARTSSRAQDDLEAYQNAFGGRPPRRSIFLVVADGNSTDGNVLTSDNVRALRDLDSRIRVGWMGSSRGLKWKDVCSKDGWGDCLVQSPLEMYQNDDEMLVNTTSSLVTPTHTSLREGKPKTYRTALLLTKTTTDPSTGIVTSAKGLTFRYLGTGKSDLLEDIKEWEDYMVATVQSARIPGLRLFVQANRSLDDELAASTFLSLEDYLRIAAAGLVLTVYAMLVSSSTDFRQSKSAAAFGGVVAAFLGYLAGTAVCHAAGLEYVPPAGASPFLILGIGVDDMFVILNSYGLAFRIRDPQERVAAAMKDCGIAISVTTLTNLIAFGIGAFSPYKAIANFCIVTLSGLAMGYIFCMTFFVAVLCIDARRETESIERGDHPRDLFSGCPCRRRHHSHRDTKSHDLHIKTPLSDADATIYCVVTSQLSKQEERLALIQFKQHSAFCQKSAKRLSVLPMTAPLSPGACEGRAFERKVQGAWRRLITPGTVECHDSSTSAGSRPSSPSSSRRDDSGSRSGGIEVEQIATRQYITPQMKAVKRAYTEDGEFEPPGNSGALWRWLFRRFYGRFLVTPLGKILVGVGFCVYLGAAIWAVLRLRKGLDLVELTPYDSFLRDTFDIAPQMFDGQGDDMVLFYDQGPTLKMWEKPIAEEYLRWSEKVANAEYCADTPVDAMALFLSGAYLPQAYPDITVVPPAGTEHTNDTVTTRMEPQHKFFALLETFLRDPRYRQFAPDFILSPPIDFALPPDSTSQQPTNRTLHAFASHFFIPFPHDTGDSARWLTSLRSDLNSPSAVHFKGRAYTWMFLFTETDLSIVGETLSNLGYAFIAVLFVSLLLIQSFRAPLLVMAMILLIDIGLFGFMWAWGLQLNMLTMVCLIISIGFSVDYTTHVVHTFSHCNGSSRDRRAVETLVLMGSPILHGAISTQLMLCVILTMNSYVFLVFFRMMTLVIGLGFLHGVILLPVVLSFCGPMEKRIERARERGIDMRSDPPTLEGQHSPSFQAQAAPLEDMSSTPATTEPSGVEILLSPPSAAEHPVELNRTFTSPLTVSPLDAIEPRDANGAATSPGGVKQDLPIPRMTSMFSLCDENIPRDRPGLMPARIIPITENDIFTPGL